MYLQLGQPWRKAFPLPLEVQDLFSLSEVSKLNHVPRMSWTTLTARIEERSIQELPRNRVAEVSIVECAVTSTTDGCATMDVNR